MLDNASYHNVKTEGTVCPKFSQKKAVLQNYPTQHIIPFSATDTKKSIIWRKRKRKKKTPVVYKTDNIVNLHGHEVLRTPFDTELLPIKLIWAQVKGFVAKNNTTFRLKDVKELTYAAFGKITKDVWTKAEEHVVKIEKRILQRKL